jgi:hypothetical protein
VGPHTDGAEAERHNRGPPRNMGNDHSFDRCCCAGFCLRASQHGLWFSGFCSHTEHFMQHKFLLAPCLGRYSDSGLPTRLLHRRACAALCRPQPCAGRTLPRALEQGSPHPAATSASLICQPQRPCQRGVCVCVCLSVMPVSLFLDWTCILTYIHTHRYRGREGMREGEREYGVIRVHMLWQLSSVLVVRTQLLCMYIHAHTGHSCQALS